MLKALVYVLLALFFTSCKSNKTNKNICSPINRTNSKLSFEQMDSLFFKEYREQKKHIYIRYKQPVEGYTVTALCTMDGLDIIFSENNGISGKALLRFENDSTHFYVYNSSFSDSILYYGMEREVKDKEVIYIDYRPISDSDVCHLFIRSSFFPSKFTS